MDVHLVSKNKLKINSSFGDVRFHFKTKIEVTREVYIKTFFTTLAEIGGYLGMTIGISLLDLKGIVPALATLFRRFKRI